MQLEKPSGSLATRHDRVCLHVAYRSYGGNSLTYTWLFLLIQPSSSASLNSFVRAQPRVHFSPGERARTTNACTSREDSSAPSALPIRIIVAGSNLWDTTTLYRRRKYPSRGQTSTVRLRLEHSGKRLVLEREPDPRNVFLSGLDYPRPGRAASRTRASPGKHCFLGKGSLGKLRMI
jgi:hypothetical protein